MANPFDRFDGPQIAPVTVTPAVTAQTVPAASANPFDQFDAASIAAANVAAPSPAPVTTPAQNGDISWSQVPSMMLQNLVPSALKTGGAIVGAVAHPVDTAEALYHTGAGYVEKLADQPLAAGEKPVGGPDEKYADALNAYIANRYGGVDAFKKSLATDPVGVATDIASFVGGGAAAVGKAASVAGKIADVADAANAVSRTAATVGRVANAVNPVNAVGKVGGLAGKAVAGQIGMLTGTGGRALRVAAAAGAQGGDAAATFLANMRGNAPLSDVVDSAKAAVAQMRAARAAAYRAGMAAVGQNQTVLDFAPIDAQIAKTNAVKNFKGIDISPSTAAVRQQVSDIIDQWKGLDPATYHTPEGMDALKQRLGDLRDSLPYNTPERLVAGNAADAVKQAIVAQAPAYAKVMGDYSQASDLISEIERTLSLNPKANVDTSLRKLQSIMRNNVSANYGRRADLGNILAQNGAPNLNQAIAGQILNAWTPRGLARVLGGGELALSLAHLNPLPLAMLPLSSPRLMGEAAYYAGTAARPLANVAPYVPSMSLVGYETSVPLRLNQSYLALPPPQPQPMPLGFTSGQ